MNNQIVLTDQEVEDLIVCISAAVEHWTERRVLEVPSETVDQIVNLRKRLRAVLDGQPKDKWSPYDGMTEEQKKMAHAAQVRQMMKDGA